MPSYSREVCYAFADVEIDDASCLPDQGVSDLFVRTALHMQEADYFEPSFDSVAKPQDASAKVAEDVVEAEDETTMAEAAAAAREAGEWNSRESASAPEAQSLLGLD